MFRTAQIHDLINRRYLEKGIISDFMGDVIIIKSQTYTVFTQFNCLKK